MDRTYFLADEKATLDRLLMLRAMVAEQPLHEEPCPLLAYQLVELEVLCTKLQRHINALRNFPVMQP